MKKVVKLIALGSLWISTGTLAGQQDIIQVGRCNFYASYSPLKAAKFKELIITLANSQDNDERIPFWSSISYGSAYASGYMEALVNVHRTTKKEHKKFMYNFNQCKELLE